MSAKFVAVALVLAASASAASLSATDEAAFAKFAQEHRRVYKTAKETAFRKRVFAENMRKAASVQARNPLATFGANRFADRTAEEFENFANSREHFRRVAARKEAAAPVSDLVGLTAEPRVDWRENGIVPAIRDQGMCGSCWAFSAVSNIESVWARTKNTTLVALSEQQLTSCDTRDGGCNGGFMNEAFQWLLESQDGWIATAESYPYDSAWGFAPPCKSNETLVKGARISGFKDLPKNETQIAQFVSSGSPVAVGLDATSLEWYFGGIITECASTEANHAVNIIGYDDTHNPPYWIVRNSWSTIWGEQGYVRIAKGSNQCLIQDFASTATVA